VGGFICTGPFFTKDLRFLYRGDLSRRLLGSLTSTVRVAVRFEADFGRRVQYWRWKWLSWEL